MRALILLVSTAISIACICYPLHAFVITAALWAGSWAVCAVRDWRDARRKWEEWPRAWLN